MGFNRETVSVLLVAGLFKPLYIGFSMVLNTLETILLNIQNLLISRYRSDSKDPGITCDEIKNHSDAQVDKIDSIKPGRLKLALELDIKVNQDKGIEVISARRIKIKTRWHALRYLFAITVNYVLQFVNISTEVLRETNRFLGVRQALISNKDDNEADKERLQGFSPRMKLGTKSSSTDFQSYITNIKKILGLGNGKIFQEILGVAVKGSSSNANGSQLQTTENGDEPIYVGSESDYTDDEASSISSESTSATYNSASEGDDDVFQTVKNNTRNSSTEHEIVENSSSSEDRQSTGSSSGSDLDELDSNDEYMNQKKSCKSRTGCSNV